MALPEAKSEKESLKELLHIIDSKWPNMKINLVAHGEDLDTIVAAAIRSRMLGELLSKVAGVYNSQGFFSQLGEIKTGLATLTTKEHFKMCLKTPVEHHNPLSDALVIAEIVENEKFRERWEEFLLNKNSGYYESVEGVVRKVFSRKGYCKTDLIPERAKDVYYAMGFDGLISSFQMHLRVQTWKPGLEIKIVFSSYQDTASKTWR